MTPYLAILALSVGLAYFAESRRVSAGVRNFIWLIIIMILGLFAGLRGQSVGTDTEVYSRTHSVMSARGILWDPDQPYEWGYKALEAIALMASSNPSALLLTTSLVATAMYVIGVRKIAHWPQMSLFLFITLGHYLLHFNIIRQGLAIGAYLFAINALLERKPIHYGVWTLVAASLHISALVMLPLYPLLRQKTRMIHLVGVVLLMAAGAAFLPDIVDITAEFDSRYSGYGQSSEGRGILIMVFRLIVCAGLFAGRGLVLAAFRQKYEILLSAQIIGTAMYTTIIVIGARIHLTRISSYLTVCAVFAIPLLIYSLPNTKARTAATLAVWGGGLLYFIISVGRLGGLMPYVMG